MTTRLTSSRTTRRLSFVFLLLLGAFAGGYGIQSLLYAQNRPNSDAAPEKPQPETRMKCPMMAGLSGIELHADSPTLLTARAEELQLNEDQKKQLDAIARSARQEAREVLSAEQQKTLQELPEGPLSMMQIAKLGTKKADEGDGKMMCPMCMKMMKERKAQKAAEAEDEGR